MKYAAPLLLFVGGVCLLAGFLAGQQVTFQEAVNQGVASWNPKPVSWIPEVIWRAQSDQPIFNEQLSAGTTRTP